MNVIEEVNPRSSRLPPMDYPGGSSKKIGIKNEKETKEKEEGKEEEKKKKDNEDTAWECPLCGADDKAAYLLVPCGHSTCFNCASTRIRGTHQDVASGIFQNCSYCRKPVTMIVPNYSLTPGKDFKPATRLDNAVRSKLDAFVELHNNFWIERATRFGNIIKSQLENHEKEGKYDQNIFWIRVEHSELMDIIAVTGSSEIFRNEYELDARLEKILQMLNFTGVGRDRDLQVANPLMQRVRIMKPRLGYNNRTGDAWFFGIHI